MQAEMFGPTRVLMWTIQRNSQRTTEQFRETCVVLFCAYMRSRPELKAAQRWACMDCHLFGLVFDPLSLARSFLNIQTNTQAQCQFELQQNLQKGEFCHHLLTLKITCWSLLTIKGNTDVEKTDLLKIHYFESNLFSEPFHFTNILGV